MEVTVKKCVMFDFDGVIVDSELYAKDLLIRVIRENYGTEISEEDALHVIGYNTARTVAYMNEKYGLSIAVDDYLSKYSRYDNFYVDYDGIKPIDGAVECIESLSRAGFTVGLVSSTGAKFILSALNRLHMTGCFDFIVTGDMVSSSKPAPDPYLKGIRFSGFSAEDCIAVEDSPAGVTAAKAAGLYTVGFKAASIKLDTSASDIEVGTYSELRDHLLGLL